MGDIKCPTCGEPWEAYHVRHDAIYDTSLPLSDCKAAARAGSILSYPGAREALESEGWRFAGHSMLSFVRCPACPKEAAVNEDKAAVRAFVTDILGEDEDGLQSELEDMDYFDDW